MIVVFHHDVQQVHVCLFVCLFVFVFFFESALNYPCHRRTSAVCMSHMLCKLNLWNQKIRSEQVKMWPIMVP